MRKLAAVAALLLVAAACGDSGTTTTAGPEPVTGATAAPPTTAPPPPATPAPTTTAAPTTTTTSSTTTTVPPTGDARFALTRVVFGEGGFVEITNVGSGPGDLSGHWVCQRPNYRQLDGAPAELQPGQSVWLAPGDGAGLDMANNPNVVAIIPLAGALGGFAPASGEIALYDGSSFDDATAIRSFVAWAEPGGLPRFGRADVAVTAEIWVAGGLVEVIPDAVGVAATVLPAVQPQHWASDLGG